ncbi:hypothetical protein D3C85_1660510 [compost metagenome]
MQIRADGVQPKHFAGDLEPRDLLAAIDRKDAGLERADSHRIKRAQRIACAVKRRAFFDLEALHYQRVQTLDFLAGHADGQA